MYRVISTFIEKSTGRRIEPGDLFEPESEQQAARLIAAGCLEVVRTPSAAPGPEEPHQDDPPSANATPAEDRPARRGRRKTSGS